VSHAEHFLSRLVRLADAEVKLALALYYDSEWVRAILGTASLPDAANYPYDKQTFGLISRLAHHIKSYSAKHGVPPIAVAGSIADEYNVQRGMRRLLDWFQDNAS
jgi:hypothetical protein